MNTMPPTIGLAIRYFREKKGLKKDELAELAGLSKSYISLLESGARGKNIGYKRLHQIATALGKTVDDLADWKPEGDSHSRLKQFVELWPELSDDEQWGLLDKAEKSAAERERKKARKANHSVEPNERE